MERPHSAPDWVGSWDNPDADEGHTRTYAVIDEPAALVWAAQLGALEWHAWTSRTDQPHRPTYALVDLDPGSETSWADVLVEPSAGARTGRVRPRSAPRAGRRR